MSIYNMFRRLTTIRLRTPKAARKSRCAARPLATWERLQGELLEDRLVPTTGLTPADQQLVAAYGQLPLSFQANQGQTSAQVQYLSQGNGYTLFLTPTGSVLSLQQSNASPNPSSQSTPSTGVALAMNLVGSNPRAAVAGQDTLSGTSDYFVGNDPSQWHTNIASYGKVAYQDVYPGINLVYYGNQQQLEYDFVVAPGANPGLIRFNVQGATSVSLDDAGNLVLQTASGNVLEHAPVLYQQVGGSQQSVAGSFVLLGGTEVGFQVGSYKTSLPLVIDPVLSYSTYLGGSGIDGSATIAVDSSGDAYIAGVSTSTNFPTTIGAFQASHANDSGDSDAFIAKLNASGTALLYSTYLGGNGNDNATGIAVDGSGNIYLAGFTNSTNFPTTPGAFQTTFGDGSMNAFVAKLNSTGTSLIYSTYLGGSGGDYAEGRVALDSSGDAYITGFTSSTNFPITPGAFQTSYGGGSGVYNADAFVTKFNASGTALIYSTYLGGDSDDDGKDIAVDGLGDAYITGYTFSSNFPTTPGAFQTTSDSQDRAFVTKLNTTGTALIYSTYLEGDGEDDGYSIAVDASGNAYVTGQTTSTNFPTTPGAFQTSHANDGGDRDVFVTKLNATGTALVYSTYLGGNGYDVGYGLAIDASGDAYITGQTSSSNFPTTPNAYQVNYGGADDAFMTELNPSGSALDYSTYLGGSGFEDGTGIAVDSGGNIYVLGSTQSSNFPTTPGAFQTSFGGVSNAYVAKFSEGETAEPTLTTTASPAVTLGTTPPTISDSALLAGGNLPDGLMSSITFTLQLGSTNVDTVTDPVTGNGAYSDSYNLPTIGTATGTYTWTAEYSGDAKNNSANDQGGAAEQTLVGPASPTIAASPGATVVVGSCADGLIAMDLTSSAKLAGGYYETGSMTFTLYSPNNAAVETETVAVNGNGTYSTPSGYLPSVAGTYQWVASYGGDSNNDGASTTKGSTPEVAVGPGTTVVGNALYLVGGNGNDQLEVRPIGASQSGGTGIDVNGRLNSININNKSYAQDFTTIYVVGFDGNDTVQTGNNKVTLGNGNDQVQAGNGAGDTVTITGNGNDKVYLGNGNNDRVSIDGNGNENVQVGSGTGDSVSITGSGNDRVQTGNGSGQVIIEGTGHKHLNLGNGWSLN